MNFGFLDRQPEGGRFCRAGDGSSTDSSKSVVNKRNEHGKIKKGTVVVGVGEGFFNALRYGKGGRPRSARTLTC